MAHSAFVFVSIFEQRKLHKNAKCESLANGFKMHDFIGLSVCPNFTGVFFADVCAYLHVQEGRYAGWQDMEIYVSHVVAFATKTFMCATHLCRAKTACFYGATFLKR